MRSRDNHATIEEIKDRTDIVDVIGRVVDLKKAGINYKGLCPFHSEKTPSFVVSETKQRYTCFGCNRSGDVISFMQEYYNMDFVEAVKKLGEECGLSVEFGRESNSAEKDELLEMNRQAARFFYKALREQPNPGLPYMRQRELTDETMRTFGIGWADGEWDSLYKHLKSLGYSEERMMQAGLISRSGDRYFDKFRSRVIFPIQNTSGKVIGFGGRAMGDDMPKYLNSQESIIFKKKNNLYGLNITRSEIGKEDMAILVEGYMDVIGLYQAGVRNVSASLGTALTENQARMLKRYTKNVTLSYDSDDAGINAALRGIDILNAEGLSVHVLTVTDGKDPDEFVKMRGREPYMQLVRNAAYHADFKLDLLKRKYDLDSIEERAAYLGEAAEILKKLSPVETDMYIKKLARENDISEDALRVQINKRDGQSKRQHERREEHTDVPLKKAERMLIKLMLTDARYVDKIDEHNKLFKTPRAAGILNGIRQVYVPGEEIDIMKLEDILEEEDAGSLAEVMAGAQPAGMYEELFADCIADLRRDELKERERDLLDDLEMMDQAGIAGNQDELMRELNKIQSELNVRGNRF